jgi:hypothetical protein
MSRTVRNDAGAFFQVRVRMPRMSSSSISNIWPGAVSVALASAMDIDGVSLRTLMGLPRSACSGASLKTAVR